MALTVARTKCFAGANARRASAPARSVRMVVRASAKPEMPAFVKPAITALVSNALLATPALAESGKLFDFNLTLPVMAGEILLLMVFLEKFWFTPVGKVLDERDSLLRSQLSSVKDGSSELDKLTKEAEDLVRAARTEVSTLVNSQKSAKQAELDKLYAEAKAKVTAETESAIAGMEKESEALLKSLDAQAEKIAGEVLRRVLPEGVKV